MVEAPHIDSAIAVRKHAQAKSEGHVLFADKLEDLERQVARDLRM